MFWLKFIRDFLKVLRAGQTPGQIAGGFALGSILGLSPMLTLQGVVVWFVILLFNVNLSAALVALTFFSVVAFIVDPLFHTVGYNLLVNVSGLHDFWTSLYNAPIAPLTRFNNTVVLGSFVVALICAFPVYLGMRRFVVLYRTHIHSKVEQWKIFKAIQKSLLVRWYEKIRDIAG
jgi:uncharacterized protein (TIGR03546 family)